MLPGDEFSALDVPVQAPAAAQRSLDSGWLFREATCFLQGGGSQEQTVLVTSLQAVSGWEK